VKSKSVTLREVYHRFLYTLIMSVLLHRFILACAVIAAYVWLQLPFLHIYSLQAFCVAIGLYFITKRLNKAQLWHIAPRVLSWEMPLVTFAVLLLVGFTGGSSSLLFPLSFILLFFLVFSAGLATAIVMTLLIMLYYYSLGFHQSLTDISNLLSLPLLLGFFLFAKIQYQQVTRDRSLIRTEAIALAHSQSSEAALEAFLKTYLSPQLEQLKQLLVYPHHNQQPIQNLIASIQIELQKQVSSNPARKTSTTPPVAQETSNDAH